MLLCGLSSVNKELKVFYIAENCFNYRVLQLITFLAI